MKRVVLFFLAVVFVAGLAAWGAIHISGHDAHPNRGAAHAWLHRELKLTADQERALGPVETRFAEKEQKLSSAFAEANRELGRAIAEEKHFTPRVAAAVETVHQRMGDLQKASIEHVFDMRSVLTPEQGEKLLSLAQKALEHHGHQPH